MKNEYGRQNNKLPGNLRMIAWEVTRSCNLSCVHCRASSVHGSYQGELDLRECKALLNDISSFANPVIILTGGESLLRKDLFEIVSYGSGKGLIMVLATNGTLVTDKIARRMLESGIARVSVSIDGMDAASHDSFRAVPGAFAGALRGIERLKKAGMEFQINTTITRANIHQIADILNLAVKLGAAAQHIFLLVPTGRGKGLAGQELSADDYEQTLRWFHEQSACAPLQLKVTCAPHYFRILHQEKDAAQIMPSHPLHAMTRGCLGGSSFCFISHTGQVQPCGYLEVDCGQIRSLPFRKIWEESPVFQDLRDLNKYKGKCGCCEFIKVCGGCRARAYEQTGDFLKEEPLCVYNPHEMSTSGLDNRSTSSKNKIMVGNG